MPYKKKYRRRKTFKNRKRGYNFKPTQPRNLVPIGLGFPKKLMMKHKYYESIEITSTGGAIYNHNYSLNGMYDPNTTGVGHQPYYFDQMSAVYNHYTVIGAKITIMVTTTAENAPLNAQICLWQNDDTTVTPSNFYGLVEQSKGKVKNLNTAQVRPTYLSMKWSAKKTFGGTVLANTDLQGTAAANPTEQSYATISFQTSDAISTTSVRVATIIEYIAIWSELKDVAAS